MRAVRVKQDEILGHQSQPEFLPGIQRADLRQKVWAAAARMPARPRRLLLRRELEGLSYAQIGAAMGMSTEKVRRRLHRARAMFRGKYAPYLTVRERRVKCRRLGDLLSGYYDGELRGMLSRRVADHLVQCPDCRRAEERTCRIAPACDTHPRTSGVAGNFSNCANPLAARMSGDLSVCRSRVSAARNAAGNIPGPGNG